MKLCRGCDRDLPESEFTKNSRAKDGLSWRCRECASKQSLKYVKSDKGKAARRQYYEKTKHKAADRKRERRHAYAKDNPEKVRARSLFGKAVRHGFISRPDTEPDWYNRWEFHHPDHSRPFFGTWVNPSEHRQIDAGSAPCPDCTDYSPDVLNGVLIEWGFIPLDTAPEAICLAALIAKLCPQEYE
jgi:hypothetical protein